MKQSKAFHVLFPFIVMSIPWIYLWFIWKDLPAIVPTHFGISGHPDEFAPKSNIFLMTGIISAVAIGVYFLLRNIYRIDPKRKYSETTSGVLAKIAVAVVIFLCAICLMVLYWILHGKVEGLNFVFCGVCLLLAYMGNLMYSIKPNYFAGFRLPWALENEDNWRETHHLASKLWFGCGIIMAILSLLISDNKWIIAIFISGILVMCVIPIVFSYRMYKRGNK